MWIKGVRIWKTESKTDYSFFSSQLKRKSSVKFQNSLYSILGCSQDQFLNWLFLFFFNIMARVKQKRLVFSYIFKRNSARQQGLINISLSPRTSVSLNSGIKTWDWQPRIWWKYLFVATYVLKANPSSEKCSKEARGKKTLFEKLKFHFSYCHVVLFMITILVWLAMGKEWFLVLNLVW